MTAAVSYTGTQRDYDTLLAEGFFTPDDEFEFVIVSDEEQAAEIRAAWRRAILHVKQDQFWLGYEVGGLDAIAAVDGAGPKPTLLRRIVWWLRA